MSDILASSITLEDILAVAEQKRVPIAPELAGYLTLELADAVNAASATGIDPKTVYVSEEGSVALVKSKLPQEEDVESTLRKILGQLLAFSGSQTPALAAVVKRKSGAGPRALVTELEAALIPVNRSAGRRALARMAREARRISLGLGRAGALAQGGDAKKRESRPDAAAPPERRMQDEAPTAQRPRTPFPTDEALTVKRSDAPVKLPVPPVNRGPAPPPPPLRAPPPRKIAPLPPAGGDAKAPPLGPKELLFGGDEVDSLLSTFGVSGDQSDKGMSTELKALVGLEPTPPPPGTEANFDDAPGDELPTGRLGAHAKENDLTAEAPRVKPRTPPIRRDDPDDSAPQLPQASSGGGDGIEDLLAMTDDSVPVRATQATEHPIEPDELPPPIAVATVKADSAARVRKAKEASGRLGPPALPAPDASQPAPAASGATGPAATGAKDASAARKSASGAGAPKAPPSSSVPSGRQPRAPKTTLIFLVIFLLVMIGGAVGIWKLAPGFFTGRTPEQIQKEKDDYEAQKRALEKAADEKRCKASLVVTGAPAGAEVLLRVGQAPVVVPRMPMKARLEFVATAEGFAPKRATVLPTAPWDTTKSPPRFDLAVQLDPSKVKPPALDAWPSGAADIEGQGEPGSVYVVSTPPGAEISLLVGLGPEARIDQLKCDDPSEVLVAGSQVRKRMRVAPGEAEKAAPDPSGAHVVTLVVSGPGSSPSATPSSAATSSSAHPPNATPSGNPGSVNPAPSAKTGN